MSDLGSNVGSAPPRCSVCEMEHNENTPCVRAVAWWVKEALARIARISDDIYGRNKTVLRQASEVAVHLSSELSERLAALDAKPEPPKSDCEVHGPNPGYMARAEDCTCPKEPPEDYQPGGRKYRACSPSPPKPAERRCTCPEPSVTGGEHDFDCPRSPTAPKPAERTAEEILKEHIVLLTSGSRFRADLEEVCRLVAELRAERDEWIRKHTIVVGSYNKACDAAEVAEAERDALKARVGRELDKIRASIEYGSIYGAANWRGALEEAAIHLGRILSGEAALEKGEPK